MDKNKYVIKGLLGFVDSLDVDEHICKKVKNCRCGEDGDKYDCMDCIEEFFSTKCKWEANTEVCVNADCEHCADFVSPEICGACKLKELGEISVE